MTSESRALTVTPRGDLPDKEQWEILNRMCVAFERSGLYKNIANIAQFVTVVQTGRELGVPPAAALRSFSFIGGKPTASAEMLAALIYRDHGDQALKVVETTNKQCTVEYRRRGWDSPGRVTFSMEDARAAGLLGTKNPNWEKYPRAMLRSRTISEAARTAFQDSILGMYTSEELAPDGVLVTPEGEMVVKDVTPPTPPALEQAVEGEVLPAVDATPPEPEQTPRSREDAWLDTVAETQAKLKERGTVPPYSTALSDYLRDLMARGQDLAPGTVKADAALVDDEALAPNLSKLAQAVMAKQAAGTAQEEISF